MHAHLERVEHLVGFIHRFLSDECVEVSTAISITSDSSEFYTYIDQISNIYFSPPEVSKSVNDIHKFLILIHDDLSADIHINDFKVRAKMRLKRVPEDTLIRKSDIVDVQTLEFPEIEIHDSDSVICCLKVGWKFLLYFNFLSEDRRLGLASMQTALGRLYRYLSFQEVYDILESEVCFKEMVADGWFPFIELLGRDYEELAAIYKNGRPVSDHTVKVLLGRFGESRLKVMTDEWWENSLFQEKRELLQAGVDAFLRGTKSDYINCIKTLYTEMEGIMRLLYLKETGKGSRIGQEEFISRVVAIGKRYTGDDKDSLLLPQQFLKYLTENVFANFNVDTGMVDLSRHSVAHGAAEGKDYTAEKALQGILILDQIYFYTS